MGKRYDIGIPEAAVVSLERAPDNKPELNGCYVSGTIAGYTAWVKIAGTDGALVPVGSVVDPLLCHVDALRAGDYDPVSRRAWTQLDGGIAVDAGRREQAWTVAAWAAGGNRRGARDGAQREGQHAEWVEGEGLKVRQTVGIERREV